MTFKKLFHRGCIGTMGVRNRIVAGPMNTGYSDGGHDRWRYTDRHTQLLASWAKGGVGLIIQAHIKVESEIDKEGAFSRYMVLDRDDWIGRLYFLTNAVHRYGTKIVIQLSAGCGRIATLAPGRQPVGPSPNPHIYNPGVTTRELTTDEIQRLVDAYGKAASRAQQAGFDGIVFHCLSQLFDQFLTPCWNRRDDKYGGGVEGRMQFVLECIESVKSSVGSSFPLIMGMVSDHKIQGGNTLQDTIKIAQEFEKAGADALYLRAGGYDAPSWLIPSMYMEDGCGVSLAQPIKQAVQIPVIVDGKIREPELAERILQQGKADFVGIARPLFADPEWPKKAQRGKAKTIRKCIACNECITRLRKWEPLGCSVNPALGSEDDCEILPASEPRKVLIIGGGPAGMEAAWIASLRGHSVYLYEKEDKLGGHLLEASAPPFKRDIKSLLAHLTIQLSKINLTVHMKEEATINTIQLIRPDVVIVATGSIPLLPDIPGINKGMVTTAVNVLRGNTTAGDEVVVLGGNEIGAETSLYLAQMGKKVTIIRRGSEARPPDVSAFNLPCLMEMLAIHKVTWITNCEVGEIQDRHIVVSDKTSGDKQIINADTVVLARGMVADNRLLNELEGSIREIYAIGDCKQPRRIWEAMHEGFHIAREI